MLERLSLLIGKEKIIELQKKTVLVIGLGGVGGYAVEVLARSGIGKLILVDHDHIEESNLNRQLLALHSTIGKAKVSVAQERILDIQPSCKVISYEEFITPLNIEMLFHEKIDFVVDACDTVSTKKELIRQCINRNIPLISCMGTGKKLDPSRLRIMDLRKTTTDPIAKILRKMIQEEKIKQKIMVVCSDEVPLDTESKEIASNAFVPSVAGILCASYVIRTFIGETI